MIDQTAEALTHLGDMTLQRGNDTLACGLYKEGLAIWRALDYKPGIVHLLERLERLTRKQDPIPPACHPFCHDELMRKERTDMPRTV